MDSINKNQAEDNYQDLHADQAIDKIKEVAEAIESCFFCTEVGPAAPPATRPMAVQQVDDQGNLWFLSADDSHKNAELAVNPAVRLYFQRSAHSGFMQLDGIGMISRDKAKIKELWKPILKTWFTEGEDDPRITVISVKPATGYYWDNKHGNAIAGVKMMIGATIGKTMDDSIEGKLIP
jgi:general stress protein 26